jgi:hypothetical protein
MVDASDLKVIGIVVNVVFGVLILLSYKIYLYSSVGAYDVHINKMDPNYEKVQRAREWMWAAYSDDGYYSKILFRIWAIMSFLAALSFIYLFASVACTEEITREYLISNVCFLFFSVIYAPLVEFTYQTSEDRAGNMFWPEVAVVVDLFLVSASAWCMVGFLVPSNDALEILASVMLATHCTIMDSFIWAYVWVSDIGRKMDIYHYVTAGDIESKNVANYHGAVGSTKITHVVHNKIPSTPNLEP